MAEVRTQLEFLLKHIGHTSVDEFISGQVGFVTLAYIGPVLLGGFTLHLFKKSAELHGTFAPDLKVFFPMDHNHIRKIIIDGIFAITFDVHKKNTLVIKFDKDDRATRLFAIRRGFNSLDKLDKGREVWKLTKEDYYVKAGKRVP